MISNSPEWVAARQAMMLDPTVTNLNTGSFGPTPRSVFEVVTEFRQRQAEEPMDFLNRQLPPLLWEARRRFADFIQGQAERLKLVAKQAGDLRGEIVSGDSPPGRIRPA